MSVLYVNDTFVYLIVFFILEFLIIISFLLFSTDNQVSLAIYLSIYLF